MGTVSVNPNQYAFIFCLVLCVSACLGHLAFDIFDFFVQYENGPHGVMYTLFQF